MTEPTMIERMARALRYTASMETDPSDLYRAERRSEEQWREWIPYARGVLEAMREPTEAMAEAIADVSPDQPHADYWRAGIDAARAQG